MRKEWSGWRELNSTYFARPELLRPFGSSFARFCEVSHSPSLATGTILAPNLAPNANKSAFRMP